MFLVPPIDTFIVIPVITASGFTPFWMPIPRNPLITHRALMIGKGYPHYPLYIINFDEHRN
jgi:hypothetical protein